MSKFFLALLLWLGIAPALAQAPPPVPALPDTERRTTYMISATTCACAVNFALYGDGTDYQNWVEVTLNGVIVVYNDPTFGWTITSPSGSLGQLARPITDAVLTFNAPQTGTVQIVGARRPRRTSQFSENQGVPARSLNQVFTDLTAMNRETWDKINDFTGRALLGAPGTTFAGPLPAATNCINLVLNFGADGRTPTCTPNGTFGTLIPGFTPVTGGLNGVLFVNNGILQDNGPGVGAPFTPNANGQWGIGGTTTLGAITIGQGSIDDWCAQNSLAVNVLCIPTGTSHLAPGSSAPTAPSGCTGFALSTGSTDVAGRVTYTSATTCTITFGHAFTNAPFCNVTPGTVASTLFATTTTTQLAVTFGTAQTAFFYSCFGA